MTTSAKHVKSTQTMMDGTMDKKLDEIINYYDILEVEAGATRLKIREAYIRLKNTYSPTNQALYSLMGESDTRKALEILEEAYRVLDDSILRKDYDTRLRAVLRAQGRDFMEEMSTPSLHTLPLIDESASLGDGVMSPRVLPRGPQAMNMVETVFGMTESIEPTGTHKQLKEYAPIKKTAQNAQRDEIKAKIKAIIAERDLGDGTLYQAIRETVGVSREELQNYTRISPSYVKGIEENLYSTLPALVYIRGFLKGYLKYLGVDDPVPMVDAFSEKYSNWLKEQKKDNP